MIKTYQLKKGLALHSYAMLEDGTKVTISFEGGVMSPKFTPGTFTTSDPKIQEHLENSPRFNKRYRLLYKAGEVVYKEGSPITVEQKLKDALAHIKELGESDSTKELTEKILEVNKLTLKVEELEGIIKQLEAIEELKTVDPEHKEDVVEELKEEVIKEKVPEVAIGITNMQAARNYLVKNHALEASKMPNGAAVKNRAEELNVEFPDWK